MSQWWAGGEERGVGVRGREGNGVVGEAGRRERGARREEWGGEGGRESGGRGGEMVREGVRGRREEVKKEW